MKHDIKTRYIELKEEENRLRRLLGEVNQDFERLKQILSSPDPDRMDAAEDIIVRLRERVK